MKAGRAAIVVVVALASLRAAADEDEVAKKPKSPLTRVVRIVRAEDEAAFAGVHVQAYGLPGGTVTKRTGDDGTVRFEKVPRKGVTFVARHDGRYCGWHEPGRWWWSMPEEDDDPDGDGVTSMTLALVQGATCEGRVVAFDDGSPVPGAVVEAREEATATDVWYLADVPIWTATTGADGGFRTDQDRPRGGGGESKYLVVRLTARAPGWISETLDRKRAPAKFRLRRAATLRGVVVGPDGKPAAGVDVNAYPSDFGAFSASPDDARHDENEHPRAQHVKTDERGRYEMPELPLGTKFFVYAERVVDPPDSVFPEHPAARSEVVPDVGVAKAGETAVCDLTMRALSSLAVVVAPDAGGDAEGIGLSLRGPPRTLPRSDDEELAGGRTWIHLFPGRYVLHADARGWSPHEQTVDVPEGERVELTVRLGRGASVDGVVVDDLGSPVRGAAVYVYAMGPRAPGAERASRDAKTDASGAFRVEGLPDGPVEIMVRGDNYVPLDDVRATAPSTGLRLVAVREPRIRLRVDPPPGGALPAKVWATVVDVAGRYAGMRDLRRIPPADFPALLDRVRPGPCDVVVDIPGFAPSTIRIDLPPGETVTVGPFAFEDGVVLSGTLTDASGRAVAGAKVVPYENDARAVTSDAHGAFVLPHLAQGTADLCVTAEGFPETRLAAASDAPLAVVLRPGGVVRGVVRAKDGSRVEDRRLCIYDASASNGFVPHWHASLDKQRKFSIRLPAGRYRFVPSRYEFDQGAVLFDVTEGGETSVELTLP